MMFADGLGDEIKRLLAGGKLVRGTTASQAIGYKDHLFQVDMRPADLPDGADDSAKFEVIVNNALKLLTFDAFCDIIKE